MKNTQTILIVAIYYCMVTVIHCERRFVVSLYWHSVFMFTAVPGREGGREGGRE